MSGTEMHDDHDPALSALYARLPQEEPPAVLDAAILAAARAATAQPRAASPRWGARLALAATLVLSTSVLLMHELDPAPRVSDAVVAADAGVPRDARVNPAVSPEAGDGVPAAEVPAAAPTAAPEPPRAEMMHRAMRSELAAAKAVAPPAPPSAATDAAAPAPARERQGAERQANAVGHPAPAEIATSEASSPAGAGMEDISGLIEREVLAGLDARVTRVESAPPRWRLQSAASLDRLAGGVRDRLGEAGFVTVTNCPGMVWSGERAGWRVEMQEIPGAMELRALPVSAPCR